MATTTIRTSGFKELEQALRDELPKATARNAMRRAAVEAMKPSEEEMIALAPKRSGALAASIKTVVVKAQRVAGSSRFQSQGGTVTVQTGPSSASKKSINYYNAIWQEFGTVKMPANPYARPAADNMAYNVIDEVKAQLEVQIGKAKDRIARKAARARG